MSVTNSYIDQRPSQAAILALPRAVPHYENAVTRRIDHSLWSLQELLDALPGLERLRVDTPFDALASSPPALCATGRLYGSGLRIARYTRVALELSAWSGGVTELRLRPLTRRVPNWSRHRQDRYFDVAHDTMDDLARLLGGAVASHAEARALPHSPLVSDPASPAAASEDHRREDRAAS